MALGSHIGVFLDRDGTLAVDPGYLADPAGLVLYPEAREAVALLKKAGARLFLVTNQSGIARGLFTEAILERIHAELQKLLGGALDAIYYCPHHPSEGEPPFRMECACRKPMPGMLERGLAEWGLKAEDCYMVGDTDADMEAGRKLGLRTLLFLNGKNREEREFPPDYSAKSLLALARWILSDAGGRPAPRDLPADRCHP